VAIVLDGVNDDIDMGSDAGIDNFTGASPSTASFSFWMKRTTTGFVVLFGKDAGSQWHMFIRGSGAAHRLVSHYSWTTEKADRESSDGAMDSTTAFFHIASTYDASSSSNFPNIYIDGALDNGITGGTPSGAADTDATEPLNFGSNNSGSNSFFDGHAGWINYDNIVWDAAQVNRAMWWGTPGGSVEVYHPLMTSSVVSANTVGNKGTATAEADISSVSGGFTSIPKVERMWCSTMGVGR